MKKLLPSLLLLILSNFIFCQNDSILLSKFKLALEKNNYFKKRIDVWSNGQLKSLKYISREEIPVFEMTCKRPINFVELRDSITNYLEPKFDIHDKRKFHLSCDYFLFVDDEFIGHLSDDVFYRNFQTGQISEYLAQVMDSLDVIAGIELSTTQYPPYFALLVTNRGLHVIDYEAGREKTVMEWTRYYDENLDRLKKYLDLN